MAGDWLSLGEAAEYLGVAQSTIRRWSDLGQLPTFYTPGRHRRYKRDDLDAFVAASRTHRPRPRALVVDDDTDSRALVRATLEAAAFSVAEAADGEECLAQLEQALPDVLLLDVMMPRLNGWELLKRVKARHGAAAPPVLLFSGTMDARGAARAKRSGAAGYVGKPFDPDKLVELARQAVG